VLAIQRAKEFGQTHKEPPLETAKRIIANIWGFDLNPLAVVAARTNYLFALGDIVERLPSIEIPIYLADSVLWPEKAGQKELNFHGGECISVQTSIQQFHIPYIWVKDEGFLMKKAAPIVEKMAKQNYSPAEALERFNKEGLVFPPHEQVVENFYTEILELEKDGNNGIWARFLKNIFAPVMADGFDFVVGNPPWIRWDYLSQEYRKATLQLWKDYGLFSLKGYEQMLGGAKPDFSMLFTYAASDYYLKRRGRLGFLITQEVFKSKGAGEGFRHFKLGKSGEFLKVLKAHDLVTIQPFEGAANKTAAIILKKGEETAYPVPYFVWHRKRGVGKIATDTSLEKVIRLLQKEKMSARPIGSEFGAWQTIAEGEQNLTLVQGENHYRARAGAWADPYGVFWLEIKQVLSDGSLIVSNLVERGKKNIRKVLAEKIEPDLVYPGICGADIERWGINQKFFVLIVNDKSNPMTGYPEAAMRSTWPCTYSYLTKFRDELTSRPAYKKFHLKSDAPFYSQYNIGAYTFSRYKVVWKRMSTDITGAVVSSIKTPFGYKPVVPLDTTVIIPTDKESEAHYLCAIINSKPVRDFIKSFSSAGRGFGTPSVMKYVGIPKFDPKDKIHQKLAQLSQTLHDLKAKHKLFEQLAQSEREVDNFVCELFGIKEK
jgi:hypothetical protein